MLIAKNQWLKTEKVRLENNRYNSALVWDILIAQNGASGFIGDYKTGQPGDFLKNALKTVTYSVGAGIMNQFGLSKVQYLDEIKTFYGTEFYNSLMTNLLMDFYSLSSYYRLSEHHIYGSSRIGTREVKQRLFTIDSEGEIDERFAETETDLYFYRGFKRYEMVNHLGNVLVVISDKRTVVCDQELSVSYFEAEVLAAYDYAPFGMMLPERTWTSDSVSYRYGFNTQEKDDEIYGAGNSYTAEYWQYDARLGRRWNLDPKPQIMISDYACFGNNPINFIDLKGDEFDPASQKRVDKHKEKTEKRLKRFSQKVERLESKNNLTEKQSSKLEYYREAKKELNSALEEIYTLESSTQMYTLRKRGAHGHGGSLSYDSESDVVYINFDGSTDNLAHELKHAYQFEVKKISFSRSEDGEWSGGLLYDAQDEVEAFRRGFAYNRNHTRRIGYPVYASSFDRITPNFIIRLGYNLPVHPGGIDRNTNAFEAWRSSTGGEELDPIYRTRTTLQLIREQNELSRQNDGRLWEKIKE